MPPHVRQEEVEALGTGGGRVELHEGATVGQRERTQRPMLLYGRVAHDGGQHRKGGAVGEYEHEPECVGLVGAGVIPFAEARTLTGGGLELDREVEEDPCGDVRE